MRQVDVAGVDSRFIERHRGVIAELLERVLPADAIDDTFAAGAEFEVRYGLLRKPPLVRFRVLDAALRWRGVSDVSVPVAEFTALQLPVRRVFVTENEVNGLAFPEVPESIVVFGLGYGVELLQSCAWMHDVDVYYWGDIDTHGFAMLDRVRRLFPKVQSFLMDRETLLVHRALWGSEASTERYENSLERLSEDERALFDDLRFDRLGQGVRLEQERIGFGWVERAVKVSAP